MPLDTSTPWREPSLAPPHSHAPPHEVSAPRGPSKADDAQWRTLSKQVKAYGWMTLAATLLASVRMAHPRLFGKPRITPGKSRGAIWAMHLIEVPIVSYISFVSLYALRRVTRATAHRFQLLAGLSNVAQLALFSFESTLLIGSFRRGTSKSVPRNYAGAASMLLLGAGLGQWVRLRVNDYLHPPLDPRFVHPQTEEELIQLVKQAQAQGVQLRVRGATHCVPDGIFTDEGPQHINVQLDRYTEIFWQEEGEDEHGKWIRVTVQGGCHLGVDPNSPLSNKKNSLLWQLEKRGWAVPDLGGITHQTVSGFISTGSMGGTTRHELGSAIVGIRLIDGTGQVHDLAPNPQKKNDEQENLFYAAGVSMGLLGIVSTVTFECRPRYELIGMQVCSTSEKCPIKLFESGEQGLQHYLEKDEYTYSRMLWWPQVDKVELWKARRARPEDTKKMFRCGRWTRRPFATVPHIVQALFINPYYKLIARDPLPYTHTTARLVRWVIDTFVHPGIKEFWGRWLEILPMDNQISDEYLPTDFTEIFIDISETQAVMSKLKEFFAGDDGGMTRLGPYAFEVYAGHKSRFWMSPSYGRHSIRIDVFWFHADIADREAFFAQFWQLLKELLQESTSGFRLHWGKYLSDADSPTGARYLRQQYPMWDKFLKERARLDPDDVFLNTYWKKHLGIGASHEHAPLESLKSMKPAAIGRSTRGTQAKGMKKLRRDAASATRRGRLYMAVFIVRGIRTLGKVLRRPRRSNPPRAGH